MSAEPLITAATQARERAYAPYSGFRVGAALQTADGQVFTGVNVENASYGLGVCAERNAVAAAVAAGMQPGDLAAIAVSADAPTPTSPCGACRQVLAEFADEGMKVLLHNTRDGRTLELDFHTLLPHAFDARSLESK